MERICEPNLPHGRVRRAFVSALMPESLINELNCMGVITYKLGKSKNLSGELAYHPDLLLNNYRTGCWICEQNAAYLPQDFPYKEMITESEGVLGNLYPYDCRFNNFRLNGRLYTGSQCDYLIKAYADYDNISVCYTYSNYTKCSTVIVDENSIITCDMYLAKTARSMGVNVLAIPDDEGILLTNKSHGLIGGCAAKLDKDLLAFTGDVQAYAHGDEIIDFCNQQNVQVMSLTSDKMYDYGGILPITELVPYEEQDQQRMQIDLFNEQNN